MEGGGGGGGDKTRKISFLNDLAKRYPDNTFITSIYRKEAFTGQIKTAFI